MINAPMRCLTLNRLQSMIVGHKNTQSINQPRYKIMLKALMRPFGPSGEKSKLGYFASQNENDPLLNNHFLKTRQLIRIVNIFSINLHLMFNFSKIILFLPRYEVEPLDLLLIACNQFTQLLRQGYFLFLWLHSSKQIFA